MKRLLLTLAVLLAGVVRADDLDAALDLAQRTLALVERAAPRPTYAAELRQLEERAAARRNQAGADLAGLAVEVRAFRRRLVLSHPALAFDRLLVTQHPLPVSHFTHQTDQYLGRHSRPGPGLVVLEHWRDAPVARPLLAGKLPEGTALNPNVSYDGQRIVFAFCDHTRNSLDNVPIPTHPTLVRMWPGYDANPVGRLRYFLYEAAADGSWVRQLTGTPSDPLLTADGRQTVLVEDLDPCYLPDGGIVFTSTRSQNFGRCHWGRYTPAFLLYRCDGDGGQIRPLSFGEANEWNPSVLPDGRILYTRWDYIDRHSVWLQSLWTTWPDGTGTAHYYGNYTQNPCSLAEARAIPGTGRVVATATAHHYFTAGSLLTLDPQRGEDGMAPVGRLTPEISFPESEGWNQPGQFANPWPLTEDLYLASFSPERLSGGVWPKEGSFGIYLVDTLGGRELIWRDPEHQTFNPMPLTARPRPARVSSLLPEQAGPTGHCYVQNVYASRVPIPAGSARFVRINRILNQPCPSPGYRNANAHQVVRGVVGTVPVNADGSVAFDAPAGEPLQLQLLDEHKLALLTMRTLIYLQPGEQLGCVGCHEARTTAPPRAIFSRYASPVHPTPLPGPRTPGLSFKRTVQPVLDRYCLDCHGLNGKTDGGLSLLAERSYEQLVGRKGLVSVIPADPGSHVSALRQFYAAGGRLAALLVKGHAGVTLPADDLERVVAWLDVNAPKYGDYSFNRPEDRGPHAEGEAALRAALAQRFGEAWSRQPFAALVNAGQPDESRALRAPLALTAGGWGQLPGWTSTADPEYLRFLRLVEASLAPLPWHDLEGTCGRTPCVCGACWVRLGGYNRRVPVGGGVKVAAR